MTKTMDIENIQRRRNGSSPYFISFLPLASSRIAELGHV